MAERKNPKLDTQHQAILKRMMQLPENKTCADCKGPYPRWASTNLGIFICMACSGIHRKLGTHLSQVRSITLDTWTVSQIAHFQKLGNAKAEKYFEACLSADFNRPHSSDSMRMEAFIRDKYEKRKYITVENGGLGGGGGGGGIGGGPASINNSFSNNSNVGSRSFTLGTRPRQQFNNTNSYDDINRSSRPTSSSSYAARFSSNNINRKNPSPTITSNFNQTSAYSSSRSTRANNETQSPGVKNPVARATTLKELVNMGFSTEIALRAVEVSGGDLQKAVDWVIQNSNDQSASKPLSQQQTQQPADPIDLLDFDEPTPAPAKTMTATTSTGSQPVDNHNDDFADFGEFETALPRTAKPAKQITTTSTTNATTTTMKPATNQNSNSNSNNNSKKPSSPIITGSNLSSSLADLYKKPAPSAKRPVNSNFQFTNSSNKNIGSKVTLKSPTQTPKQAMDAANNFGLATLDLKTNFKSTKINNTINGSTANIDSALNFAPLTKPPTPPPLQESAFLCTENDPPPPSPPMSFKQGVVSMSTADKAPDTQDESTDNHTITEDTSAPSEQEEEKEPPVVKEKEDEDPFAALSMMALSSASSGKRIP